MVILAFACIVLKKAITSLLVMSNESAFGKNGRTAGLKGMLPLIDFVLVFNLILTYETSKMYSLYENVFFFNQSMIYFKLIWFLLWITV